MYNTLTSPRSTKPLFLSVCSESCPTVCTSFWALKALRALTGPQIKFSDRILHRQCRDQQILKSQFSCLYLFPFSHKAVPKKALGWVRGRVVYHTLFFGPGLKLDGKSMKNGLEGQKCLVIKCLFLGWLPTPYNST